MTTVSGGEGITDMDARPNIVFVHGAWADGSCWSGVIAAEPPLRLFLGSFAGPLVEASYQALMSRDMRAWEPVASSAAAD